MATLYKATTTPYTVERMVIEFLIADDLSVLGPTVVNSAVLGSGGPKHVLPSVSLPKSPKEQLRKEGQEMLLAASAASQGGLTYSHRLRQGLSFVGLLLRGLV